MDAAGREREPLERLRHTQYTHVSSRPSTIGSAHSHMTSKTSSRSSSQSPNTTQSIPDQSYRHHRSSSGRVLEIPPPPSRLSKEIGGETRRADSLVSSFLQERLDQQRKAEGDRISRKMCDLSSSTGDIRDRDIHSSPMRSSTAMGRWPQSNTEDDDVDNSMGLKEMEKVCNLLIIYFDGERQD